MDELQTAIEQIAAELPPLRYHRSSVASGECRKTPSGAALLSTGDATFAIAALREAARFARAGQRTYDQAPRIRRDIARDLAGSTLRRKLPWTVEQLGELLDALADNARSANDRALLASFDPVKPVLRAIESFGDGVAPPELHERLREIAALLRWNTAEDVRAKQRVLALLGEGREPDDPWSAALRDGDPRLLELAATATSSRPTKQFAAARDSLGPVPVAALITAACRVTSPAGEVVPAPVGDTLRGLAWIAGAAGGEDAARALGDLALYGWKKVPSRGPLCSKAANAALAALGELPEGAAQLGRVRAQLKQPAAQRAADAAIERAAERLGIRREEFEERVVPDFGLGPGGTRTVALGEYAVALAVSGALRFTGPSGKPLKSVPAALKRDHADELAALKQAAKDVKVMAAAQKLRLERLLLADRTWEQEAWRAAYLDHGLVGTLARRLIWTFDGVAAFPSGDGLVDAAGEPVDARGAQVRLWHPVGAEPAEVLAWRRFLEEREILQPFKQAHREVYLLTDAERTTGVYSNRFAAHVLRQHQMAALARGRGWTYALQGAYDTPDEAAELRLPEHGLRVAFWVQRPFDTEDYNDAGIFMHVLTDQVRFHALDHDDDAPAWQRDATAGTVALDTISPRVFSEAMRDVDLFVGVSSIGNDPTWADRGDHVEDRWRVNDQYLGYWSDYAFGELGEAGRVRRDLLERLLPKLAIADRAHLDGRFLRVRGTVREYKIHLGSGNILMEPNDAYLCIVPGRDASADKVFLPFDGDSVLAIVLSKAFMLARDDTIEDPTILSQIRV